MYGDGDAQHESGLRDGGDGDALLAVVQSDLMGSEGC